MELYVKKAYHGDSRELFAELSSLDRLCVGAEGWSADSFESEAAKDNGIVLYISENERIIALICGYYAVGEGDITSVAVHPDFRRRGLALRLISEFEAMLPDDAEDIFLEVRESNSAAVSLYEKCGFKAISIRKNFYESPIENAIVMKKSITCEV